MSLDILYSFGIMRTVLTTPYGESKMSYSDLTSVGHHVFTCPVSKIKFWLHDNGVWATFLNTRFNHLADKAVYWGSDRKLENIIEFQKGVYNR